MGCEYYDGIQFSEGDDSTTCLCTFPHNDSGNLGADRVRALAYLGAAVVLRRRGELEGEVISLTGDLPAWIRAEIDRRIPEGGA
jgi:hypothetical protein